MLEKARFLVLLARNSIWTTVRNITKNDAFFEFRGQHTDFEKVAKTTRTRFCTYKSNSDILKIRLFHTFFTAEPSETKRNTLFLIFE